MIPAHIEAIDAAIINALVGVAEEGPTLDFKRDLPKGDHDGRKSFLGDVCAFANSKGGDLLFGMDESASGLAGKVVPHLFDSDKEILSLTSALNDGIEPRLHGVEMRAIDMGNDGRVLVVRVPRSFSGIHRSKRDNHFWVRESRSNRSLDVPGLTSRIAEHLGREDRIADFFARRYAAIATSTYSLNLMTGPKVVVHILPTRDILSGEEVSLKHVSEPGSFLVMPNNNSSYATHTFEGILHHLEVKQDTGAVQASSLILRSGVVEAVAAVLPSQDGDGLFVPFEYIESLCSKFLSRSIPLIRNRLNSELPLTVRIALVGVAGQVAKTRNRSLADSLDPVPHIHVHSSVLVFPDVLVEEIPKSWALALEGVFNRMWQSWGYPRALSFQHQIDGIYWCDQKQ